MNIGKSIEIMLIRKEWSKGELQQKLNTSPSTITRLCASKTCTGIMQEKLADIFDMEVSEFIAVGEG